jgi:HD-GYP domain-containing protein (c-di-GMP phosphodiesterase class II)
LDDAALDEALRAFGDFADLKSPFTVGHSDRVATLAGVAAGSAGLPTSDAVMVRRAGWVHDVGRVGVPSTVWHRQGQLSRDDWEQVRLHPYLTERMLARPAPLASLATIAGLHHERCDGSGYHRAVNGSQVPPAARVLCAADAFAAMTEPRPHRPALPPERAAEELQRDVVGGRHDPEAVTAVLAAAGRPGRRRQAWPRGLSAREVEVLRLLARGASVRAVAEALTISPKTADNHVQHVYAKLGVSTRAAATYFALQHGLVAEDADLA